MWVKLHRRDDRTFSQYGWTSFLKRSSQTQTLPLTHPHWQLVFLLNHHNRQMLKHRCRWRRTEGKKKKKFKKKKWGGGGKKQRTKKPNQPHAITSTKTFPGKTKHSTADHVSWRDQACRPPRAQAGPAAERDSPSRSHLPAGRLPGAPLAGKAAAGGRLLSAAPMAHMKPLLEQHRAKHTVTGLRH